MPVVTPRRTKLHGESEQIRVSLHIIVIWKDGAWRFGRFPSDVGFTRLVRVPKRKVKANSKPANLSRIAQLDIRVPVWR